MKMQTIPKRTEETFPPLMSHRAAADRLHRCARLLRDQVRRLQGQRECCSAADAWLLDNHSFVQFQIRELRRGLPGSYLRGLPRTKSGPFAGELRIYRIAVNYVIQSENAIDADAVADFGETLQADRTLRLGELWAFSSMLKLAILERLCANRESEPIVSSSIRSLRALETVSWCDFVESVSAVEEVLRRDPAGIYPGMDFATRDRYRHDVEAIARRSRLEEESVAEAARSCAEQAVLRGDEDDRKAHLGYYLIGPGAKQFRRAVGCKRSLGLSLAAFMDRWPSLAYVGGVGLGTALILAGFHKMIGPFAWWIAAILAIPASQAALEIVNALVSRLLPPRSLPSMDFSEGIPEDCKSMVVIPTLLLSPESVARLLEGLEIRYLANRAPNLYFALLTDFPDAACQEVASDSVLISCIDGIHHLNARYGSDGSGPFYLFHRARKWNPAESRWMGYERKRGKLNDLNKFLLSRGNSFDTITGDVQALESVRYIITLDTDTQLPRDTAVKMIGAMAHPLNRPILDAKTRIVKEGYALVRPRVSVSMESSGRSLLAQIFSGQTGFDPYTTAVSDVYQDLHGQASFTGKGIYDLRAFDAAVGDRFPDNAILSHDLIEGEHARTSLLTSVEVIEDYPASYQAFSKRKHRWVRGDWQLLPWLFRRVPSPGGSVRNPLPFLSRWKIFDNLRRSLFEICVVMSFALGWLRGGDTLRWTIAMLVLLQLPAYVELLFMAVHVPERRLWGAFLRQFVERFGQCQRDVFVNLVFIPHQACMMGDATIRTLWRRFASQRHLLEWETMAQSEQGSPRARIGMMERYLWLASGASLLFLLWLGQVNLATALICSLWIAAPLFAAWLNQPLPAPAALESSDRAFLRDVALRTWRYFADHSRSENRWLVPDTVQQDPPLEVERISPTNLGLLMTSHLAAHDFGYVTAGELAVSLRRIFDSMEEMPRYRGHFFNWYDTSALVPLAPHYVSTVDSGNLRASLCVVRQGCSALLKQSVFQQPILDGLRDHVLRLRDALPSARRSLGLMRLFTSLLRQLECQPTNLFFWEAVFTDARDTFGRIREALRSTHAWLREQGEDAHSEELAYWEELLAVRIETALAELYALAPWLEPAFEPELRVNIRDASLAPLLSDLCVVPALRDLPEVYERIRGRLIERLIEPEMLYPKLRMTLQALLRRLPDARAHALEMIHRLEGAAADASRTFEEMDFRFLYDARRKLLRIGYDVDAAAPDDSCYDLLASEARSAVFLAIAKGEIPREAWFRLGRKLTPYGDLRTLVSWSGTMFEYLMPLLYMRSYPNTLLDRGLRGAVAIQQVYARERDVPWGISEAAYSARDHRMQYQYRAFGVPEVSARPDPADGLVVAPYASMLALMMDAPAATANLRLLASAGCLGRNGFIESVDYSRAPQLIRCFMAHHQAMGLLAIDNALLGGRIEERFHADPLVQATEFLLQERMPALVEVLAESERAA